MRPPNTISNIESLTSFLSLIFSEGRGGGSVHRLGIPSKEGSGITNSVQIYTCSSKNSAETHLISFKSSFDLEFFRLNDAFQSSVGGHKKRPKRKKEKKETKWIEITGAWENLAIFEQFSISIKIVTIYTLFALGPSITYICKQKLFRQNVNRLWN